MKELFIFLRKHKVLIKYKKNFKKYGHFKDIEHFCTLGRKEDNIAGAFAWEVTDERQTFWSILDKKWKATL